MPKAWYTTISQHGTSLYYLIVCYSWARRCFSTSSFSSSFFTTVSHIRSHDFSTTSNLPPPLPPYRYVLYSILTSLFHVSLHRLYNESPSSPLPPLSGLPHSHSQLYRLAITPSAREQWSLKPSLCGHVWLFKCGTGAVVSRAISRYGSTDTETTSLSPVYALMCDSFSAVLKLWYLALFSRFHGYLDYLSRWSGGVWDQGRRRKAKRYAYDDDDISLPYMLHLSSVFLFYGNFLVVRSVFRDSESVPSPALLLTSWIGT